MTALALNLPFPPSTNHYYRNVVMGKRAAVLISKRGREYREEVLAVIVRQPPLTGRLAVQIELYPPTKRAFDLGNYEKALCDALTHAGVWEDDSQIDDLRIVRREKIKGGLAVVAIAEVGDG